MVKCWDFAPKQPSFRQTLNFFFLTIRLESKSQPDSPSCEIEISQDKKSDEDDSGVTTRRSQRRKTRPKPEIADDCDFAAEIAELVVKIEEKEEAEAEENVAEDDNMDGESVTSELDSLTSGSTLTTR